MNEKDLQEKFETAQLEAEFEFTDKVKPEIQSKIKLMEVAWALQVMNGPKAVLDMFPEITKLMISLCEVHFKAGVNRGMDVMAKVLLEELKD